MEMGAVLLVLSSTKITGIYNAHCGSGALWSQAFAVQSWSFMQGGCSDGAENTILK
jgi:hypothetical protein